MDAYTNQSQSGTEFHVPCSTLSAYTHRVWLVPLFHLVHDDHADCRTFCSQLPLVSLLYILHLYRYITIFFSFFFLCRSISVSVPFSLSCVSKENPPLKIEKSFSFFYLWHRRVAPERMRLSQLIMGVLCIYSTVLLTTRLLHPTCSQPARLGREKGGQHRHLRVSAQLLCLSIWSL